MELTRRDALVAVAASTVAVASVGELVNRLDAGSYDLDDAEDVLFRLEGAAQVVYPSEVTVSESFLRTYLIGREYEREEYLVNIRNALDELDRRSKQRFNAVFAELSVDNRETLLRKEGVAEVTPDPNGTALERIRYYIVNQLLYALYTSPTGGRLIGNENPPGYPGGRKAYQEGPIDE